MKVFNMNVLEYVEYYMSMGYTEEEASRLWDMDSSREPAPAKPAEVIYDLANIFDEVQDMLEERQAIEGPTEWSL